MHWMTLLFLSPSPVPAAHHKPALRNGQLLQRKLICAGRSFRLRDAKTLREELERVSSRPGSMPTYSELVAARRGDLRYALSVYHGGMRAFARRYGLSVARPTGKDPSGRSDVEAAMPMSEAELHKYLKMYITSSVQRKRLSESEQKVALRMMPRVAELQEVGRADLLRAIRIHGGSRAVALKMGLLMSANAVTDYKGAFDKLACEIFDFMDTYMPGSHLFPTSSHFRAGARLDIISGIRVHGGTVRVAEVLNLKLQRGPRARTREDSISWLKENFAHTVSYLPTNQELLGDGRIDVLRHIFSCGGREEVAKLLSLPLSDGTIFSEDLFSCDVCTSETALKFSSEESHVKDELRGGGGGAVSVVEGGRRRRSHYFLDFSVLKSELDAFIFDHGQVGIMPTARQLIQCRRRDLLRAMQLHGGQKSVANRLGLVRQSLSVKKVRELASPPIRRVVHFGSQSGEKQVQTVSTPKFYPFHKVS